MKTISWGEFIERKNIEDIRRVPIRFM